MPFLSAIYELWFICVRQMISLFLVSVKRQVSICVWNSDRIHFIQNCMSVDTVSVLWCMVKERVAGSVA